MAETGETYLGVAATKPYVDELSAKVSSFIEAFNIPSISGDPILAEFIEQPDTVDISVAIYAVCYMFKKLLHQ